jgi:hypothetical protein
MKSSGHRNSGVGVPARRRVEVRFAPTPGSP